MYPAIHIFGLHIYSYSLMIFLGIICALISSYFMIYKSEKISVYTATRLIICCIISGIALYFGAFFFDALFHTIEKGELTYGGITWLGGVVVSFPICILLIHKLVPVAKGRALYTFSLIVPQIVLAHAFGRVGCFLAGCCYGKETTSFLGVTFPDMDYKVLPTQLFEAVFELLLYLFMVFFRKKTKGHNLEIYFISYGIFRFILEFFRGDSRGSTGLLLTPAQCLDIIIIICAIFIILFYKQKVFKKLYMKCLVWQQTSKEISSRQRNIYSKSQTPQEVIKELFYMKESGIITEEEFQEKKEKLLDKIGR